MGPDEYDLAGAGTGVVEASELLGPARVRPGDVVLGLASSGVHSNGYSLVRHVLRTAGLALETSLPELGRDLGEELLEPTRIYSLDCLELTKRAEVHAFAHITGGGLAANLARSLPGSVDALLDRASWTPPPIFEVIAGYGRVPAAEMDRTFNLGVGMCAVVAGEAADQALGVLRERGQDAWVLGEIIAGTGEARFKG
jgi:phosphoribosylformylglycinamidine cyclo-ligase